MSSTERRPLTPQLKASLEASRAVPDISCIVQRFQKANLLIPFRLSVCFGTATDVKWFSCEAAAACAIAALFARFLTLSSVRALQLAKLSPRVCHAFGP